MIYFSLSFYIVHLVPTTMTMRATPISFNESFSKCSDSVSSGQNDSSRSPLSTKEISLSNVTDLPERSGSVSLSREKSFPGTLHSRGKTIKIPSNHAVSSRVAIEEEKRIQGTAFLRPLLAETDFSITAIIFQGEHFALTSPYHAVSALCKMRDSKLK